MAWQILIPQQSPRIIEHGSRRKSFTTFPSFQKRSILSLYASSDPLRKKIGNLNGFESSSYVDLDELWNDEWLDEEPTYVDGDEPEAFLSEDDLSELYGIEIQSSSSDKTPLSSSSSSNGTTSPQIISLKDMNNLASDLSYFYLRDEIGLGEDIMWEIANSGASSILMMKVTNICQKVDLLRKMMKLSEEEIRKLLSAHPGLLQLSTNKNLSPTILFLLRQLDLGTNELKAFVLGCPSLLAYSIPNLQEKLHFFDEVLGCTIEETRKILLTEPKIMTCSINGGILPRYHFLLREVHIPKDDIRTILKKNPRILLMSVEENLQPKIIFFLIMTLRMTPKDVRTLLLKYPGFLNYNLDNHILPMIRYFLSLDISAREISLILLKFPRLVTNSLVKIKRTVGYLRYELGLDADGVRRILYQAPEIVGLSSTNLQSKVDYLFGIVAPDTRRDDKDSIHLLGNLIIGMPSLLHLNMERNLEPKVSYLRSVLGQEGLSKAIQRLPVLLAYSLEKRIEPRMEKILQAGLDGGAITVGIPKSEQSFQKWLEAKERKEAVIRHASKLTMDDVYMGYDGEFDGVGVVTTEIPPILSSIQNETDVGQKIAHWTRPRRSKNSPKKKQ